MKSIILTVAIALTSVFMGCDKEKDNKEEDSFDCGCSTDRNIWYDNYLGHPYEAYIGYDTTIHPNGWVVGFFVSEIHSSFNMKICNPDLQSIKEITDTIPKLNGVPVGSVHIKVFGKIKNVCPDEDPHLGYEGFMIPETYFGYIKIKSLKIK
jgi:hypothetical protein